MVHGSVWRRACVAAVVCFLEVLPCSTLGPPGFDSHMLIQTGVAWDSAEPLVPAANQSLANAATAGAPGALSHEGETTETGPGTELGRDLLIASLDQAEFPDEFIEDHRSWAHDLIPRWRSTLISGTPQERRQRKQEVQRLGRGGRFAQSTPVFVVMALSFTKLRDLTRNSLAMSRRNMMEGVAALILYCISGPAVILVNKHIMKHHTFHFPILLASLGNVFLMIATRAAVAFGWQKLETEHLDWNKYFKVVVPINIFNFLTQTLGMYAFLFISVPQIQILKSTTIVMVLFFAWLIVNEKVNGVLVCSVLVISAGVCVSAMFEAASSTAVGGSSTAYTLIGVGLMVSASAFEAAKTVVSQVLMCKMSLFDGIYHSSPTFVLIATVFVGCMEARGLYSFNYSGALVGLLVFNALITGVIVLSSFWFVKLAGALTLKVVTQARSIGLILCSVFFFGEFCTGAQYVGYTMTLIGMGMFDHAKQVLMAEEAKVQVKGGLPGALAGPQAVSGDAAK